MLHQKGSGILCVFMTIGGLLIVMSLAVRYATYGIDIAHQRTVQEQRYFALKGLLNYGIMVAEKQTASDLSEPLNIDIDSWLMDYTGKIVLSKAQDTMVNVHAYLYVTPKEYIDMQQTVAIS